MDADTGDSRHVATSDGTSLMTVVIAMAIACILMAIAALCAGLSFSFAAVPALAACGGLAAVFVQGGMLRNRDAVVTKNEETVADRVWELNESVANYRTLIDTLGDLVVHRDTQGRILFANDAFARFCGQTGATLIGKTFTDLGLSVEETDDTPNAGGTGTLALTADGNMRWFSWTTVVNRNTETGTVIRQAIGRDITDALRAKVDLIDAREKALQASRAKSRFLATVSHEIRTPLNGIIGMAKLLADTNLSPEQITYTDAVTTSGAGLLALIEDLLDFSRIEAGRFEPQYGPASLRELTEGVVELLAPRAYGKSIGIGCHIARDIPETFTTDSGRLRQVLINLVGNAVKFTETGGVLVSVGTATGADGQMMLTFKIEDSGPGISDDDQRRIFGEFEQADGTTTRRHGGAGLGLSISRSIVEALGGTITVESTVGRGSAFTITLPAGHAAPAAVDRPMPLAGQDFLIVSRNAPEARALAAMIADQGGRAAVSARGKDMKTWRGRTFAAVLIEPDCDPVNGREELKSLDIKAEKVVILTLPTDRERLVRLREDGFDAFLARPVRRETLTRILALADKAMPAAPAKAAAKPKRTRKSTRRMKVLVAEDNEVNALLVHVALTKAGYDVDIVGDGQKAVDRACAAQARYDVILMDLHMPVMDGPDAIRRIRRHEEEKGLPGLPILALTADGQSETRDAVLAQGATGFLTKPIDPSELARIVGQAKAA